MRRGQCDSAASSGLSSATAIPYWRVRRNSATSALCRPIPGNALKRPARTVAAGMSCHSAGARPSYSSHSRRHVPVMYRPMLCANGCRAGRWPMTAARSASCMAASRAASRCPSLSRSPDAACQAHSALIAWLQMIPIRNSSGPSAELRSGNWKLTGKRRTELNA